MGKWRFGACVKPSRGEFFRADARESSEVVFRRLSGGFPLFDSVTYISAGSLYSKAPIWSGLKNEPVVLALARAVRGAQAAPDP